MEVFDLLTTVILYLSVTRKKCSCALRSEMVYIGWNSVSYFTYLEHSFEDKSTGLLFPINVVNLKGVTI